MDAFGNTYKNSSVSAKVVVICSLVTLITMASSCITLPKDPEIKIREEAERPPDKPDPDSHRLARRCPDTFQRYFGSDLHRDLICQDYKGGLNAVLSVAYISPDLDTEKGRLMADSMLKIIRHYPETYPEKFALSRTPEEVRSNFSKGLVSLVPCLENGSPAGEDLQYLEYLKDQGIAYITLCHSKANLICDSNFDPDRKWNGLSPLGSDLIREMNRLGIMVDISHSSDSTVIQALRISEAPVIASHSSCRHFVPGFERNLPDDLIRAIAEKKGVVMVNFCTQFLDSVCLKNTEEIQQILESRNLRYDSKEGNELILEFAKTHRLVCDSRQLVDHIEHVIKVAGIDYVGLGSDFDGVGPLKPSEVPDVSAYPVVVFELLKRGYSEDDIVKILSANFLRVWEEVQRGAGI